MKPKEFDVVFEVSDFRAMAVVVSALLMHMLLSSLAASEGPPPPATTRILFGSCNRAEQMQPLWTHVLARQPHAWVWGGDNVYADRVTGLDWSRRLVRAEPATRERLRELYAMQREHPEYAALVRSPARIIGTWDDHDYGLNDGDRTFQLRDASQRLFLDFMRVPPWSPRRFRRGVYASHLILPPRGARHARALRSAGGSRRRLRGIRVVLLDVRFSRDPYEVGESGDFLGEAQWAWLERTLRRSRARAHLIVSGLQVLPAKGIGEGWTRFPRARERLLSLLHRLNVPAPVLLSGDVHMAELNIARCSRADARHTPTALVELTSSGMTHSWNFRPLPNLLGQRRLFDGLAAHVVHAAMAGMPWRYQARADGAGEPRYARAWPTREATPGHGGGYYLGRNFGQLDVHWDATGGPSLRASIIDASGREVLARTWALSELDLDGAAPAPRGAPLSAEPRAQRHAWAECVPHSGGAPLPTRVELMRGALCALALLGVCAAAACHTIWRAVRSIRSRRAPSCTW